MSTVLIVEDDEDLASLFDDGLSRHGFSVTIASNCADARLAASARLFDAIVTDVSLPDGSGDDLAAAISPRPRALVVMSGFADDYGAGEAIAVDARLVKPIDIDALAALLDNLLIGP